MTDWKWLVHPEFGAHRVPDNPGVVPSFEGRGWSVTDLDGELPDDSEEVTAAVEQSRGGGEVEDQAPVGVPEEDSAAGSATNSRGSE